MIKSFGVSLSVIAILLMVSLGVTLLLTRNNDALSSQLIDSASRAVAAQQESAVGGDGLALVELGAEEAAPDQTLPINLAKARVDLMVWVGSTMLGALAAIWLWLLVAFSKGKSVIGAQSARSAAPHWWAMLVMFGFLATASGYYVLKLRGLAPIISVNVLYLTLLQCVGLGVLGYYLGTALGTPTAMRPSVPFAYMLQSSSARRGGS